MALADKPEDYLSLLKNSLSTIKKLKTDLEKQTRLREPIAVIGMGCRFPGGSYDPQTFWKFLTEGGDGVIEAPQGRWRVEDFYTPDPNVPFKIEAGFLQEDVGEFDARFFGISPLEAADLDPQQRLLLEVSWEALERAGISASRIKGTQTGVFIGIIGSDYASLPRKMGPYAVTGTTSHMASGRIAYILGVHGPAISLDTACSSSLVAVHLACESLQKGESTLALAGGVNLMLSPMAFMALEGFSALAKDGRCKTFDANGDGYGRGEGCGIVVLKKLSDALRDKDPILAVIRGTGINNDGPGSGLTVPNGIAQKQLISKTLAESNISPSEINYIEAHGTGTALGDPIEVQALTEVFGKDSNRENPLIIGSAKNRIGHLEAAAGIAGLIKTVICLQNKAIPPNLHLNTLNPRINLERIPAVVPKETIPWETGGKPRIAGISSFGFSGTNAHLIISEPPRVTDKSDNSKTDTERPQHILALSAKDQKALSELILRYQDYCETQNEAKLENICFTANAGRTHFTQRIAFIAESMEQMKTRFSEYFSANLGSKIIESKGKENSNLKLSFLFNGKSNKVMAKSLFETQPVFRKTVLLCNERFGQLTNSSFLENIIADDLQPNADTFGYLNEVIAFTCQFGLFKLWESWGVKPKAVLGSESGEFVAACAAEIMNMETALLYILENHGIVVNTKDIKGSLNQPKIRFVSGSLSRPLEKQEVVSGSYWENIFKKQPKVGEGIQYLCQQGFKHCLGIGTESGLDEQKGILSNFDNQYFPSVAAVDPWLTLLSALANLYCLGLEINWVGFDQDYLRHKVILPTYPFQRKRFWCEPLPFSYLQEKTETKPEEAIIGNLLEGKLINSPIKEKQIEYNLSLDTVPDLRDTHGMLHVGYYLELLSRTIKKIYHNSFSIKTIEFLVALIVPDSGTMNVSVILSPTDKGEIEFSFYSYQGNWNKHVQGIIQLDKTNPMLPVCADIKIEDLKSRGANQYSGTEFYQKMQDRGLILGQSVQWIEYVWSGEGEALARFRLPEKPELYTGYEMGVHPGVFDACAQLFHAALPTNSGEDMRYMVVKWENFVFNNQIETQELWCQVVLQDNSPTTGYLNGIFKLFTPDGNLVARINSGSMKGISMERANAFKQIFEKAEELNETESESEILNVLRSSAPAGVGDIMAGYLQQLFSAILKMPLSELDINEPLMDLGMDSLVGLQAKTRIEKEFLISLPIEILIQGPSIRGLTESLLPLLALETNTMDSLRKDPIATDYPTDLNLWIMHRKSNPSAKIKLFCFPYGGGGASAYREWQAKLPDFIEVCPVQLPGKENRIKERAFTDINEVVEILAEIMLPELELPYAFYGHSMGALIAYRLAYQLWREFDNKPKHLFVGAYSSPSILPNPALTLMSEKFKTIGYGDIPGPEIVSSLTLAQLKEILGFFTTVFRISSEIDITEELGRLLLPGQLAELQLVKSHNSNRDMIFNVPITVIHGKNDHIVRKPEMNAWKELTKGDFKIQVVLGDHMFLHEDQNQKQLLETIAQVLKNYQ